MGESVTYDDSPIGWGKGQTAEDFADLVHEQLGGETVGVVVIPCEDFTLPDHVVHGGNFEHGGISVPYTALFSGAIEHFYGNNVSGIRAVRTTVPVGQPYSMALELTITESETGSIDNTASNDEVQDDPQP